MSIHLNYQIKMKKRQIWFSLLMLLGVQLQVIQTNYQIVKIKIHLAGNGGWDYLTMDEGSSRLLYRMVP